MAKRKIITKYALIILSLILIGCGDWGWEKIETDYEPELNIFGFISTDSVYASFVSVHQTLNLNDPDYLFSNDTIWYGDGPDEYTIDSTWGSSFVIRNAVVTISHGNNVYPFFYVGSRYKNRREKYLIDYDSGLYIDTLNQFKPKPNEEYFLSVSTSDGRNVTGRVITPFIPLIKSTIIPDTLSILNGYSIEWIKNEEFPTLVWIYKMDSFNHYGYTIDYGMLEANDTIWQSSYVSPLDYHGGINGPDSVEITVMSVDRHYYDFMHNQPDEFISLLIGSGNNFNAVNVDGGLGLFTAMSASRVFRVITK